MQIQEGKDTLVQLSNGPIDNSRRSCTNVYFAFLYIILMFSIFGLGFYMNRNANIDVINRGYDPDHRPCGIDELKDYPYIYFTVLNEDQLWKTVCVSECPSKTITKHLKHLQNANNSIKCAINSVITSCNSIETYNSVKFDSRVCIPVDETQYKIVYKALSLGFLHQMITDINEAKYTLFIFVLIALFFTILFIYLLKWCSKTITWLIIIIIILLSLFLGYYSYLQYRVASNTLTLNFSPQAYLLQSIIWWCIGLGTIILTCCFYKRINLAIAIIKSATDFVNSNQSIIIIPIISFLSTILFTLFFIYVAFLICANGQIGTESKQLPFGQYQYSLIQYISGFYLLFFTFWTYAIIIGTNSFTISGCVCIWYWQQGRSGQIHIQPVKESLKRCFIYHFGSIVLGALLLGMISIFRAFFEYLYRNAEYMRNTDGCRYCFKCCTCCIWCFERFLQYLNQNIYVQINMKGDGFFNSAKRSLDLMTSNPSIVTQVVGLGDLINNIARIMITLTISLMFLQCITQFPDILFGGIVINAYNPTILLVIIAFVIATVFSNIFGISIESILHLYCMDEEIARIQQNSDGPTMCPAALKQFIENSVYTQKQ